MKTFRIIRVALMAVLLAASFGACSKMENDEPQKRLVKIAYNDPSILDFCLTFKYDNKGLLKSSTLETVFFYESTSSTLIETYDYEWNSQSIDVMVTSSDDGIIVEQYEYTYHLSEGLIHSKTYSDGNGYEFSLGYDSSNRLTLYDDQMIAWDNDKLTSINVDQPEYWYTKSYTYGNTPQIKGYSPLLLLSITGESLILSHPEIAGLMTNKIPETEITLPNESNKLTRYEYEIDKDGYISKVIEIATQAGVELWSTEYTIEWE